MSRKSAKTADLRIRVSTDMKEEVRELGARLDESESVIVRQALREYIDRRASMAEGSPSYAARLEPEAPKQNPPEQRAKTARTSERYTTRSEPKTNRRK